MGGLTRCCEARGSGDGDGDGDEDGNAGCRRIYFEILRSESCVFRNVRSPNGHVGRCVSCEVRPSPYCDVHTCTDDRVMTSRILRARRGDRGLPCKVC